MAKRGALAFRHRLTHDLAQRVAERGSHREGDDEDGEHDEKRLARAPREESQTRRKRSHPAAAQ